VTLTPFSVGLRGVELMRQLAPAEAEACVSLVNLARVQSVDTLVGSSSEAPAASNQHTLRAAPPMSFGDPSTSSSALHVSTEVEAYRRGMSAHTRERARMNLPADSDLHQVSRPGCAAPSGFG